METQRTLTPELQKKLEKFVCENTGCTDAEITENSDGQISIYSCKKAYGDSGWFMVEYENGTITDLEGDDLEDASKTVIEMARRFGLNKIFYNIEWD